MTDEYGFGFSMRHFAVDRQGFDVNAKLMKIVASL